MNFPKKHTNTTVNQRGWGLETVVHNNSKYCVKILDVEKGRECSLHYHKQKEESFLVLEGQLEIIFEHGGQAKNIVLDKGESIDIPEYMPHKFLALEDSRVLEASNQDLEENDLIRIKDGDSQRDRQLPISNRDFIEWEQKCNRIRGK